MITAGALPALCKWLPDWAPPALQNLIKCPKGFGISPSSPPPRPCQLQQLTDTPGATCQLQSLSTRPRSNGKTFLRVRVSRKLLPDVDTAQSSQDNDVIAYSGQDLAILGIVMFSIWEKASACTTTKQPEKFKRSSLVKLVKQHWTPCGLRLRSGIHVKKHPSGRFDFDGQSLLQLVMRFVSNTKGRTKFKTILQSKVSDHYSSLDAPYRPMDFNTLVHVHWTSACQSFRPTPARRPPPPRRKTVEEPASNKVLDDAVQAIVK